MKRGHPSCQEIEPDCFNCKFKECYASTKTIKKQLAFERQKYLKERNDDIVALLNFGYTIKDIAEKYDLTPDQVYNIRNSCKQ